MYDRALGHKVHMFESAGKKERQKRKVIKQHASKTDRSAMVKLDHIASGLQGALHHSQCSVATPKPIV